MLKVILAIDATVAFMQMNKLGLIAWLIGLILIALSFFTKKIATKIPIVFSVIAGIVVLCILTGSIYFLVILLLFWLLNKLINKPTTIEIKKDEICINKPMGNKKYLFREISFIVLKDGVLTIQLLNNHFIQNEVLWETNLFSVEEFNEFCKSLNASRN